MSISKKARPAVDAKRLEEIRSRHERCDPDRTGIVEAFDEAYADRGALLDALDEARAQLLDLARLITADYYDASEWMAAKKKCRRLLMAAELEDDNGT